MNWPKDIHNKRARRGTAIFMVLLLLFIFFFGLSYINPPPNSGPTINFGFDENGGGETSSAPKDVQQEQVEESTPVTPPPTETTPVVTDEVTTQDVDDAIVVEKEKPKEKPKEKIEEKKEPVKEEPKPSNALSDRLSKTKNQQDASNQKGNKNGEGETKGGGDQGDPNGDKLTKNRDGEGGPGSGNYRLGGRKALKQPVPKYICDKEGRVVVKVYVNRSGKVENAIPGVAIINGPASTTSANCLLSKAKEAAMGTTWQGDANANEQQMGYIIYNFSKK